MRNVAICSGYTHSTQSYLCSWTRSLPFSEGMSGTARPSRHKTALEHSFEVCVLGSQVCSACGDKEQFSFRAVVTECYNSGPQFTGRWEVWATV